MNYLLASINYVSSDQYFWIAMALTVCIGLFIGAVLYDGILKEVKKACVVLCSYCFLLLATNYSRIVPIIYSNNVHDINQPWAGVVTIIFVTFFYLVGMLLGVKVTNLAHKGKEK